MLNGCYKVHVLYQKVYIFMTIQRLNKYELAYTQMFNLNSSVVIIFASNLK